jgi:hypothetical protein
MVRGLTSLLMCCLTQIKSFMNFLIIIEVNISVWGSIDTPV